MITCGGQTSIIMSDMDRIRPRGWKHRYCEWNSEDLRHSCMGPAEVHHIVKSSVLLPNWAGGFSCGILPYFLYFSVPTAK